MPIGSHLHQQMPANILAHKEYIVGIHEPKKTMHVQRVNNMQKKTKDATYTVHGTGANSYRHPPIWVFFIVFINKQLQKAVTKKTLSKTTQAGTNKTFKTHSNSRVVISSDHSFKASGRSSGGRRQIRPGPRIWRLQDVYS